MLIGIDASRASGKEKTGTENYSRNLILNLAKIDRKNNYILYVKPDYNPEFDRLPKNFRLKVIAIKRFWTQIGLSREMLSRKPDVLFVPSHVLPPITPKKNVVTVHDLAWKYFPGAYSKSEIRLQKISITRAIKKNAQIIVYSQSTLSDLNKFFLINDAKISFVPMGFECSGHCESRCSSARGNPDCPQGQLRKTSLPFAMTKQKYILSVSRLETRKNIVNLIRAYNLLRNERKIKEKLVLVGKPGFGYDEIKAEINRSKYKNDITETGFIADTELKALYYNASVFVFPSLYEGFGFPILEAFTSGVPVVTSSTSSMPEVAGRGALLVDPKKPFEIAAAMSQILNKQALAEKLIRAGKIQVKKYSWELCAKETLKVLEHLCGLR